MPQQDSPPPSRLRLKLTLSPFRNNDEPPVLPPEDDEALPDTLRSEEHPGTTANRDLDAR